MKSKFCVLVCFLLVLGFSGVANALYISYPHNSSKPFLLTAYKHVAAHKVIRHYTNTGSDFGKGFIPNHRKIAEVYTGLMLNEREPHGRWGHNYWRREANRRLNLVNLIDFSWLQERGKIAAYLQMKYGDGPRTKSAPVPEPGTILLMGIGLLGLAGYGRRRLIKH